MSTSSRLSQKGDSFEELSEEDIDLMYQALQLARAIQNSFVRLVFNQVYTNNMQGEKHEYSNKN